MKFFEPRIEKIVDAATIAFLAHMIWGTSLYLAVVILAWAIVSTAARSIDIYILMHRIMRRG